MTKLLQIGDTVRADRNLPPRIVAGRLYKVRSVRSVPGEAYQDVRFEGIMGVWFSAVSFKLESRVPETFQLDKFVRRIKAGHGGVVEGGVYQIVGINRTLGLIQVRGIKSSFRASSFQLIDDEAPASDARPLTTVPKPSQLGARTVGWKNDNGDITCNPNVAAMWITTGRVANVQRVYVEAA